MFLTGGPYRQWWFFFLAVSLDWRCVVRGTSPRRFAKNATLDIIVIFPSRVPIPRIVASTSHDVLVKLKIFPHTSEPLRRQYLSINFLSGPMVSVLLLLAVKAINGTVLKRGITGADGIEPISIMALFISLVRGLCPYVLPQS